MANANAILWRRIDMPGHETSMLSFDRDVPRLEGVAVLAHDGRPCEMACIVTRDAVWNTVHVDITATSAPSESRLPRAIPDRRVDR